MEKNFRRYLKKEGINQPGCLWMFISIFGSNQKRLLMDNKRGSKRLTGTNENHLTCYCEKLIEEEELLSKKDHTDVSNATDESEEIIKRLIAQKEGEIQTCKDLLEAFHVLSCEEESFMKKISNEEKTDVVSKQEEAVIVPKRKSNFFSRKWKSEERRNKTIVVLKPGPNSLDVDSSSGPCSKGNKSKNGRAFSRFLIGLIKRRLQSSVGKKSCDDSVDKSQNSCVQEEIESNEEVLVRTSEESKKIMSGLYIAAKKHLSEMLANGDIDMNLPDKEVPRILGKILSLPEFSSPSESPRLIPGDDLVTGLSPLSEKTEEPKILQCGPCTNGLTDEDSDKDDDETLFTIDVSIPKDHEKETENIDKEEKTETCSSPISRQVEFLEEDEDTQSLNKEMSYAPSSPPESPVRMNQCKETAFDIEGELSPVSVLEPLFTDDESSPTTTTRFSSAEMRIQPLCIRFEEEADSPKPDKANDLKTSMDEKEATLAYIEAVVKSSGLSWEELLARPFYSEQLLEKELTDDIDFCSTNLCDDKNLLFDCINEVLLDFSGNELIPGPWISFVKPQEQLISDMEIAAKVAQEGVYWHLLPLPSPHTLDQIVRKDMAKTGSWMDLRFDIGCIGSGTSEMILDDLVEEIIRSCIIDQCKTRTAITCD